MDYNDICEKILTCDKEIKDVYIVNNEAHLTACVGKSDIDRIDEAQLAEIFEDILFMVGSRKHHENVFGRLEYVHIKHRDTESIVFPFEKDKVLCICTNGKFNEKEIANRVKEQMLSAYSYV
jgi:hypothetical protein